jgi:O-antigen ligase
MKPLDLAAWAAALLLSSSLFAHTVALRLLLLVLGIGLVAAAAIRDRRSLQLLPPIWIPLALWAAWSVASLAWSLDPERSAKELRNEIGYSIAAFWLCFVAAQARAAPRIVLPVVGLAAAALCTVTLYDYLTLGWSASAFGLHGGPGNVSSALVILLPCAAGAAWYGREARWPLRARSAAWALVALLVLAAYQTLNRTVWIAFAVQVGLLGLFAYRRRAAGAQQRGLLAALALGGALALGVGLMLYKVQSERAEAGVGETLASDPRPALWREAVKKISERPLTGYGFGRGMLRESLRDEFKKVELWHSHNLFLDAALQAGIPGLLLLVALFATTLWQGWRLSRSADAAAAVCGIVLIAVVLGTIVRNLTDVLWVRQSALLYWAVVGVLLAWGARYRDRAS